MNIRMLRARAQRVEVADDEFASWGKVGIVKNADYHFELKISDVHSFELKWRTREDSNL